MYVSERKRKGKYFRMYKVGPNCPRLVECNVYVITTNLEGIRFGNESRKRVGWPTAHCVSWVQYVSLLFNRPFCMQTSVRIPCRSRRLTVGNSNSTLECPAVIGMGQRGNHDHSHKTHTLG